MATIRDILDEKTFRKLQRRFGGRRIWIPKVGNLGERNGEYFRKRNEQIRKMREVGYAIENIATRFGLSEKRIYSILTYDTDDNLWESQSVSD